MMRKWRVRLYRYGLRLTYDIVISEPAGALREAYAKLDELKKQIGPFHFGLSYSEITEANLDLLKRLADLYGAQLPPLPQPLRRTKNAAVPGLSGGSQAVLFPLSFDMPDGYWVKQVTRDFVEMKSPSGSNIWFDIVGANSHYEGGDMRGGAPGSFAADKPAILMTSDGSQLFLEHAVGQQTVIFWFQWVYAAAVQLTFTLELSPSGIQQWQSDVWNALLNAAQTKYYADQQDLAERISRLEEQINNVDTLTLRREESEEIMKGVLQYILGPSFNIMPTAVLQAIQDSGVDTVHGAALAPSDVALSPEMWTVVRQYEDKVRFINQAIEWENVVSFLYSYFWDVPHSWAFVRQIRHPDANRQAFLRAGSARVVLTVRKGWEAAWVSFAESGVPGGHSQYFKIAQEIAAYDDRNYPGIPPANPARSAIRIEDAVYTTSASRLSASVAPWPNPDPQEIEVDSSVGFSQVGAQVVIDNRVDTDNDARNNDLGKQEAQIITEIRDDKHITVRRLR